jgi:glycosyltransferase involved in cell wall biosynthesis
VIAHLGPGGAQRVAVNAANALVERGIDVHIIVVNENKNVYELDPRVALHVCSAPRLISGSLALKANFTDLKANSTTRRTMTSRAPSNLRQRLWGSGLIVTHVKPVVVSAVVAIMLALRPIFFAVKLMRIAHSLRRRLKAIEADAVLSFLTQTNILTVIATRGLRTRTVVSERNDPRLQRHRPRVELLRRLVYRWADVVTANSRGALTTLEPFVPKEKLAFLPNPLTFPSTSDVAALEAPTVITVGRLVEQKGIDILLEAWAKAVERLPEWRLAIVGDGPLRDGLQALAKDLKVENTVDWYGHVADPFPLLRAAQFFILTSRFEGTPNALLEAMACGLSAIVSDASPGPCELVGSDENAGLIVPVGGITATADALVRLGRGTQMRRRLADVARERAREYEADQALGLWLQILRCE